VKKFAFVLLKFVSGSALVFVQAPGTSNGRVVDPEAVVPKAAARGVVRDTHDECRRVVLLSGANARKIRRTNPNTE
jgi:hypothetical protein